MARPSSKLQAQRMFAILNILQENSHISLEHLGALLETTPKETERIVEKLACCGLDDFLLVPIYIEDGEVHITDDLPALQKPLRLSTTEATALLAALKRADVSQQDPLSRKLEKAAITPTFERERLENLFFQNEHSGVGEHLKSLALAIEHRLLTRISYRKQDDEEARQRVIEPLQLMLEGESWYLRAWCREASALRVFRVDRIKEVELSNTHFSVREFEPTWQIMQYGGLPLARIELDGSIDPRALSWPGLRIVEQNTDHSIVEVPFSGEAWISTQVISLLGSAKVVSPPELVASVARRARALREEL